MAQSNLKEKVSIDEWEYKGIQSTDVMTGDEEDILEYRTTEYYRRRYMER